MLFMVIEHFRPGAISKVGERFQKHGRMLPAGVAYHASWIEPSGARCFQVMEAPDANSLQLWIQRWEDLVDFRIIPVVTSAEFWSQA
jgi:hypothetical protein